MTEPNQDAEPQQNLPGTTEDKKTDDKPSDQAAILARMAELEQELERTKAENKKRKQSQKEAERLAAEDEARKRGDFETLLKQREAELKQARELIAETEAEQSARLERMIARMPEDARRKFEVFRNDLSVSTQLKYVETEIETAAAQKPTEQPLLTTDTRMPEGRPPPVTNPGVKPGARARRQLDPRTYEILEQQMISPLQGEHLIHEKSGVDGNKFFNQLTTMIHKLNIRCEEPPKASIDFLTRQFGEGNF